MARTALKVIGVTTGVVVLAFLASVLLPGERMNGWKRSVDLRSGREHYERYFLCLRIAYWAEDTDLSRLHARFVGPGSEPYWVTVASHMYSLWAMEITYRYGRCWFAGRTLAECLNENPFTDGARRACVTEFFRLAQMEDGAYRAPVFDRRHPAGGRVAWADAEANRGRLFASAATRDHRLSSATDPH